MRINCSQKHPQKKENLSNLSNDVTSEQIQVWKVITAYRNIGFKYAQLDPLQSFQNKHLESLSLDANNLEGHLDQEFYFDEDTNSSKFKLADIINKLNVLYCSTIGFEFNHISDSNEREWLQSYVEDNYLVFNLTNTEKSEVLYKLIEAEGLESYLQDNFPEQDRYSIEGVEGLLPALERLITMSASKGINEIFFGMQHRGRLNVQVNLLGKTPKELFDEFKNIDIYPDFATTGDTRYHKGCKCHLDTKHGKVKVTVAYNPSHLEIINPVVTGMVRAQQDRNIREDKPKSKVMGIILHGDAAFSGLGTNQGLFNMSKTNAYDVGGIIHIVINNQLGRTTETKEGRSTPFCTDIAKMVNAPIIHVNADDIESVLFAIDLATDYRCKFGKDIAIDLVCFRRYGHEETEDPTQTQPYMYQKIKAHPGSARIFANKLLSEGIITEDLIRMADENYKKGLHDGVHINAQRMLAPPWYDEAEVLGLEQSEQYNPIRTGITKEDITKIADIVTKLPNATFKVHPKVANVINSRAAMAQEVELVDFGMAETLAYGSLLQAGISIRLCGEDSCRSVFGHRHALWYNQTNSSPLTFAPLSSLENNSKFSIFNSTLNEECAMGFEYGYSAINLRDLVIWEAYSGDFANGAQVIIDQFIATGETKWGQLSALTLLLPHGFDGGGPEHSSARIERFLQLCAENNMLVTIPTTAAQFFHLLRLKALNKKQIKPLIIFLPKKLLNFEKSKSPLSALINDGFCKVLGEQHSDYSNVQTIIICSGQIYYDIIDERCLRGIDNVTVIRLEQLYPYPDKPLTHEIVKYVNARHLIWVQEEPYNQGPWLQIRDKLEISAHNQGLKLDFLCPSAKAAPVYGNAIRHTEGLKILIERLYKEYIYFGRSDKDKR